MSHISKIELKIHSLQDLKEACRKLGLKFHEGQKTYKWYGKYEGDTSLPEGIKEEDLGKCDHAIHVPKCSYEVGVVRKGNHYILLWDSWYQGGLKKRLGKNAGILKQAYAVERVKRQARMKGYHISQKKIDQGIRLVLRV